MKYRLTETAKYKYQLALMIGAWATIPVVLSLQWLGVM